MLNTIVSQAEFSVLFSGVFSWSGDSEGQFLIKAR